LLVGSLSVQRGRHAEHERHVAQKEAVRFDERRGDSFYRDQAPGAVFWGAGGGGGDETWQVELVVETGESDGTDGVGLGRERLLELDVERHTRRELDVLPVDTLSREVDCLLMDAMPLATVCSNSVGLGSCGILEWDVERRELDILPVDALPMDAVPHWDGEEKELAMERREVHVVSDMHASREMQVMSREMHSLPMHADVLPLDTVCSDDEQSTGYASMAGSGEVVQSQSPKVPKLDFSQLGGCGSFLPPPPRLARPERLLCPLHVHPRDAAHTVDDGQACHGTQVAQDLQQAMPKVLQQALLQQAMPKALHQALESHILPPELGGAVECGGSATTSVSVAPEHLLQHHEEATDVEVGGGAGQGAVGAGSGSEHVNEYVQHYHYVTIR